MLSNYNQGTIHTTITYFAKLRKSDKKYLKTLLQNPFYKQNKNSEHPNFVKKIAFITKS